ncbi:MAG: hypothetical protein VW270_09095 [Candidatus Poseidoniales archaeon]
MEMEKTGTCSICGINLWAEHGNRPSVFPCGVKSCPYETEEARLAIEYERSTSGSSLAQILESMD